MVRLILLFISLILSYNCYGITNIDSFSIQRQIDSLDRIMAYKPQVALPKGNVYKIKIHTQEEFNILNEKIIKAIINGETNIKVIIYTGVYHFREKHLSLNNLTCKDVSITIEGRKATITSESDYCNNTDIDPWSDMKQLDGLIDVIDQDKKLCFVSYTNNLGEISRGDVTKIQVTQWYKAPIYDVTNINENGVYFDVPELTYENRFGNKGYNVNMDFLYGGKNPRFRLFDSSKINNCTANTFLNISNSHIKKLSIKGLSFVGNKEGDGLFVLNDFHTSQVDFEECIFEQMKSTIINAKSTNNVVFGRNLVSKTCGNELLFYNGCQNVFVSRNKFNKCGMSLGNTFCIICHECNYSITDNVFCDFGYCAIGVGVWHGHKKSKYSGGIIERNELYFGPDYFANSWKYMMMDSGAIYVWTQNDNAIIRYNYIHDYSGAGDNRGIFCDDGASNVKIYKNVIINTPNGYSIDSRMVKDQRSEFSNNANNLVAYNVVDNGIRFIGYEGENRHCLKGVNFLAKTSSGGTKKYVYENLEIRDDDIQLKNDISFKRLKKNNVVNFVNKVIARSR